VICSAPCGSREPGHPRGKSGYLAFASFGERRRGESGSVEPMRVIDGLSKAQRVIVVVALGLALAALGSYLVSLGGGFRFGWYAYSPLTSGLVAHGTGLAGWLRLIIWLALIGLWAAASVRVLRPSPEKAASG
jgi:hypothetical protein